MKPKIYINGISSISAQNLDFEENPVSYHKTIFPAISPNYKEFIKPMALRRMSKAIKMGITSAKVALNEAKIVDELSEKITQFRALDGQLKSIDIHNLDLLKEDSPGTITSEGSHFFTLSTEKNNKSYAEFRGVSIKNSIQPEKINDEVEIFLNRNNINAAAIDVVILGNNGDNRYDHYYKNLQQNLFKNTSQLAYKHLVGDYDTVSGFALYSACKILKSRRISSILKLNTSKPKELKNILIYNQYLGRDHSLILLSAV